MESTTLVNLIETYGIPRIDLLKMDCEGAEGDILRSTPADYLRKIPKIVLEFHDDASSLDHLTIATLLENMGFNVEVKRSGQSSFGYIYAYQ